MPKYNGRGYGVEFKEAKRTYQYEKMKSNYTRGGAGMTAVDGSGYGKGYFNGYNNGGGCCRDLEMRDVQFMVLDQCDNIIALAEYANAKGTSVNLGE